MSAEVPDAGLVTTSRLEAFSDGVFAIAITLLVLDIAVPAAREGRLWAELGGLWPHYGAYAISFLTIGVMWANHHSMMHQVGRVDPTLIYLNLALLAIVAFIPFPTGVLAAYLGQAGSEHAAGIATGGANAKAAIGLYGLTMIVLAIAFSLLWLHLRRRPEILTRHASAAVINRALAYSALGGGVYVVATAISVIVPYVSLVIYAVLVVVYAVAAARQTVTGTSSPDPQNPDPQNPDPQN
jgi:uncharacterized membrane protein